VFATRPGIMRGGCVTPDRAVSSTTIAPAAAGAAGSRGESGSSGGTEKEGSWPALGAQAAGVSRGTDGSGEGGGAGEDGGRGSSGRSGCRGGGGRGSKGCGEQHFQVLYSLSYAFWHCHSTHISVAILGALLCLDSLAGRIWWLGLCLARVLRPLGCLIVVFRAGTTALSRGSLSFDWLSSFFFAGSHQYHVKQRTPDSFA